MVELILGTWKLDPVYGKLSNYDDVTKIIDYAIEQGVTKFDTAYVYGQGKIEKILGQFSEDSIDVITKIPSLIKAPFDSYNQDANKLYPENWLYERVISSSEALKSNTYTMLLHNFGKWNNMYEPISYLNHLKKQGYFKQLGVSISNDFYGEIPKELLNIIDFVEAPFNNESNWINSYYQILSNNKIDIGLRSLLKDCPKNDNSIYEKLEKSISISNNLIIGATKKNQINENLKYISMINENFN